MVIEPHVEVEHVKTALQIVSRRGVGDTNAARRVTRGVGLPAHVSSVGPMPGGEPSPASCRADRVDQAPAGWLATAP